MAKKRIGGRVVYARKDGTYKGADAATAPRYTTSDKTVEAIGQTIIQTGYNTDREDVDSILAVTAYNDGIIGLDYGRNRIQSEIIGGSSKYPVKQHTIDGAYVITSKAYNEKAEHAGVNWDNVEVVTGRTYGIGSLIKPMGFEWNDRYKIWSKKSHITAERTKYTQSELNRMSDREISRAALAVKIKSAFGRSNNISYELSKQKEYSQLIDGWDSEKKKRYILKYGG